MENITIQKMEGEIYKTQKMLKMFLLILDNEKNQNLARENLNNKLVAEFDLNNSEDIRVIEED